MNTAAISWNDLNKIIKNKQIVLYGFGQDWIYKTLKKIKKKPLFIIDNNNAYKNKSYKNIKIISYKDFKKLKLKKIVFIITTALINEISNELELEKYKKGVDFFATPELKDFIYLQNISKYNFKILFSSSDYALRFKDKNIIRKSKQGGGLYLFDSKKNNYKKLYSGQVRQFEFFQNKYFLINHYKKILVILNKNFKILKTIPLDQNKDKDVPPNFCGLAISKKKKTIFVANSSTDKIYSYSLNNFKLTKIIDFKKINKIKKEVSKFHINDLFLYKNDLYISFFSLSGNYNQKNNINDGGVISLNLNNFKIKKRILNLSKPHSPVIRDGRLYVLDSLNGNLLSDKNYLGKFNGFIRGLDFNKEYYFIAQSEDMYSSLRIKRNQDHSTMCNAGIYIFDSDNKIKRFFSVSNIMNIHHIKLLDV